MITAEEVLSDEFCNDILTINLRKRKIIIPRSVCNIGVESDDDVRLLHFRLPRHYCEVDLSEFTIHINYENAIGEGDVYDVKDPVVEEDQILFDWLVGRNAVAYKGDVRFNVCLKDVKDGVVVREFNTTVATLPVLIGLETGEAVAQEHKDLLEQWRNDLFGSGESIQQDIINAGETTKQEIITAGDKVMAEIGESVGKYVSEHADELKGEDGVSISTIERTSGDGSPGTTDTYTITLTDGSTHNFTVYNGMDGNGIGDMRKAIYDPQNRNTDVFNYVDTLIGDINTLLDSINGEDVTT